MSRPRAASLLLGPVLALSLAGPATAQSVYHLEKDGLEPGSAWTRVSNGGMAHVQPVSGIYHTMLEEDLTLHAFAWCDGHSTTDGQPTYSVQASIHRQPKRYARIPDISVSNTVALSRSRRNVEWRIPMVAVTYHVFPANGRPDVDRPLAVMAGRNPAEGFRASVANLPYRHLQVRAYVDHEGEEHGRPVSFQRAYTFRTPVVDVVDGRHEPYDMYHWLW